MIALLWLAAAGFLGWTLLEFLVGDWRDFLLRTGSIRAAGQFLEHPLLLLLLRLASAFWIGALLLTWLTYLIAWKAAGLLPWLYPLIPANVLSLAAIGALFVLRWRAGRRPPLTFAENVARASRRSAFFDKASVRFWVVLAVWILGAYGLMSVSFCRSGNSYLAGYSTFSDFAPHTALMRSFAVGWNWPTQYPHFALNGIQYHFLFFFMSGNLHALGLPLDWAVNLPSLLGLASFAVLLGSLATLLTGFRAAWVLSPALFFLRSSFAFFSFLGDLVREYGLSLAALPEIARRIVGQNTFIGNTRHDDWGLWTINVYANQRHFLTGLVFMMLALLLLLPELSAGLARLSRTGGPSSASAQSWRLQNRGVRRRTLAVVLITFLMPYWHGSALIGLLLLLAWLAIFSEHRLMHLSAIASGVLGAVIQQALFAGSSGGLGLPVWRFGFLAGNADSGAAPGVLEIITYLLRVSGLALPLLILAWFLPGWRRKVLIPAFLLPTVLAFTLSLTPDITVNHKYILMTFALGSIYIADLLPRLWQLRPRGPARLLGRAAAIGLSTVLMITGVADIIIYANINRNQVSIAMDSPLTQWIIGNTDPQAVFVSSPLHYHAFFLSGRQEWLGHAYYAWSAGHDTLARERNQAWLLGGCDGDVEAARFLIRKERLDYLMIDDGMRQNQESPVDETFFAEHFPLAAEFPSMGNTKIYALRANDRSAEITGQRAVTASEPESDSAGSAVP